MITKCKISTGCDTIETPDGIIPIMKYKRGAPFDKSSSIDWRCAHTLYAYWEKHEPEWLRLFDRPEIDRHDFLYRVSGVTCNGTILLTTPLEEGDGYRFDALTDFPGCIVVYHDNTVSVCKCNELPSTGQITRVYEVFDVRDALPGDVLLTREDRGPFSCYKLEYQFHL